MSTGHGNNVTLIEAPEEGDILDIIHNDDASVFCEDEDVSAFMQIVNSVPDSCDESSRKYTDDEIYLIAEVVYAEARGEPYEGQLAVATVVLNRVESENFPDTVYGVVSQKNAFSCWSQIKSGNISPLVMNIMAAVDAVDNRDTSPYPKTMVWFRAGKYHSYGTPYKQIGNHYFSLE